MCMENKSGVTAVYFFLGIISGAQGVGDAQMPKANAGRSSRPARKYARNPSRAPLHWLCNFVNTPSPRASFSQAHEQENPETNSRLSIIIGTPPPSTLSRTAATTYIVIFSSLPPPPPKFASSPHTHNPGTRSPWSKRSVWFLAYSRGRGREGKFRRVRWPTMRTRRTEMHCRSRWTPLGGGQWCPWQCSSGERHGRGSRGDL
jgi:hypothetical protein